MRTNLMMGRLVLGCAAAAALVFACSNDDNGGNTTDGGPDASMSTGGSSHGSGGKSSGGSSAGGASSGGKATGGAGGSTSGGSGGSGASAGSGGTSHADSGVDGGTLISICGSMSDKVACGQYIVEHIEACGDCHTPRNAMGMPDTTKILAGNPSFLDLVAGDDAVGNIPAPNLTQLAAQGWTAKDVVTAIRDGKAKDGTGLFPAMPYPTMHNMVDVDAEAVAAFILQLTPIANADVKARQPLPGNLAQSLPVPTVKKKDIPNPVLPTTDIQYDAALRGKYIAGEMGPCLDCHTEQLQDGETNMAKAFEGGRAFGAPFNIVSANITPDPSTGQADYTPGAIKTLLKTGKMVDGGIICPPMPAGPNGAFGGLTDDDALSIGAYITHLPPAANGPDGGFPMCSLPMMDGGMDAGKTDASK
jgi:hypothetical protein